MIKYLNSKYKPYQLFCFINKGNTLVLYVFPQIFAQFIIYGGANEQHRTQSGLLFKTWFAL